MDKMNNEIDLIELSKKMMVWSYHFFMRSYKLLIIALILGALTGFCIYTKDKDKYVGTITGTSYFVNPSHMINIINSLQDIIGNDREKLKEILNLKSNEINKLLMIKADTVQSFIIPGKEYYTTIKIEVHYKKGFSLKDFSKKLCLYIDNNDFINSELLVEKSRCKKLVEKYEEEIGELNQLQGKILNSTDKGSMSNQSNLLVLSNNTVDFFSSDVITLETEKQKELKKLERITGFTVINETNGLIRKAPLFIVILKTMGILFGIGLLICAILEFRRQVIRIETERRISKQNNQPLINHLDSKIKKHEAA